MTKNILAVNLIVAGFMISCSSNELPGPVAEKFIIAYEKHDLEEAAKYSTKETAKMLKQLQRIEELENRKPEISNVKIQIVSEEIHGNKATVFFKQEGSDTEEKIFLKKVVVDGGSVREWRVALSKTDVKIPQPFNGTAVPDSLHKTVF